MAMEVWRWCCERWEKYYF